MLTRILSVITILSFLLCGSAEATIYNGNGQSGFGGPLGGATLEITDNCTDTITFSLQLDDALNGNDSVILYLDTVSGGFADTSGFTDTSDPIRRGISVFDGSNRSVVNFSGFSPDYAIGADSGLSLIHI